MDYSGGTGILINRLRLRIFDRQVGMLIVDSSPKFLRVALEHFRDDPRVALRLIRWLKDRRRLQYVDEVVEPEVMERGFDAIVSTNAIHLYGDLADTLRSWERALKPSGLVFINSGNIRNPQAGPNEWILDETVYVIHEIATGLVRTDPRYSEYRSALDDGERMAKHLAVRDRVFLAPRPVQFYVDELNRAGLLVEEVTQSTIEANVDDWFEFMKAYHEPLLGWIGGSAKIDGRPRRKRRWQTGWPSSGTPWTFSSGAERSSAVAGRTSAAAAPRWFNSLPPRAWGALKLECIQSGGRG